MNDTHGRVLALFGASGATGRKVIQQALARGVRLKALVRRRATLEMQSTLLEIIEGDLLARDDVERTLDGCDAVCCVFGPHPPYTDIFCAAATRNIVASMQRLGIRRIVCQTGGMVGDYPRNRSLFFTWMVKSFDRKMPQAARDRAGQERALIDSGLDWTIVKPSRLSDAPARGRYVAGPEIKLGMLSSIARADLAAFLLDELFAPRYLKRAVFIKN